MKLLDKLHSTPHVRSAASSHDPVCDMWVDPATAPAKSEHDGRTIHFCAPACKRVFDANPTKFLARLKTA